MELAKIEKEIIYLLAIKHFIDEMVNFEIVKILRRSPYSEIRFQSMTHQKFFNIILVDFLSCPDTQILGEQQPYLQALTSICKNPFFNKNNSIENLRKATQECRDWFDHEFVAEKIWLPSIELETDLLIKRSEFIKICGNISKHNLTRLSRVTKDIIRIFKRNGKMLEEEGAFSIIEEFYNWFHNDILNYHGSTIAEMLNNIRWAIYEYLQPEFRQSIVYKENDAYNRYRFTYPKDVCNKFAQQCYWELMNEVSSKPYVEKFEVTRYLKMRY